MIARRTALGGIAAASALAAAPLLGQGPSTARQVFAEIRRASGQKWDPNPTDDRIVFGNRATPVTSIATCFTATIHILRRARAAGLNYVVPHVCRPTAIAGAGGSVTHGSPSRPAARFASQPSWRSSPVMQDPRLGRDGRAVTEALATALGLARPKPGLDPAEGLVYAARPTPLIEIVRRIRTILATPVRLVGDPRTRTGGIAFATKTSRPDALAPLLARDDVDLLIAGEVHETETTAYVEDAIALNRPKALLLAGAIAMEEPAAQKVAAILGPVVDRPVAYLASAPHLVDVD